MWRGNRVILGIWRIGTHTRIHPSYLSFLGSWDIPWMGLRGGWNWNCVIRIGKTHMRALTSLLTLWHLSSIWSFIVTHAITPHAHHIHPYENLICASMNHPYSLIWPNDMLHSARIPPCNGTGSDVHPIQTTLALRNPTGLPPRLPCLPLV
jgi:hypothetical protein